MSARVTLLGKPGCHLCDDARTVVQDVCAELDEPWDELDVTGVPDLFDRYRDYIPVVLVDGQPCGFWRLDPQRLRAALGPAAG